MSEDVRTIPELASTERHGTSPLPADGAEDPFSQTMVLGEGVGEPGTARPDDRLQPGSMLRDRYRLLERVDSGSMGVVYKALDRHLGQDVLAAAAEATVAIKVLSPALARHPEALRALQQEAAKGRCLHHPNIVRFIDLDREDDLYFIVMEWLDGHSLAELLDSGALADDRARALDIIRQLGEALHDAHQRGVIHADVKPGNVIVLPDGTVKLVDFGVARIRQQRPEVDQELSILRAATPAYASMQVLTGEEPVASDDVFSLACLAYRMIAGHRVFGPRNAAEAAAEGMEPQRPPDLDDAQWKALRKGLSYARVARQSTPRELVAGLAVAVGAGPTEAADPDDSLRIPPEALLERRFATRRARRWPWVLLLLLAVAGTAAVLRPDWRALALERAAGWIEQLRALDRRVAQDAADDTAAGEAAVGDAPAAVETPPPEQAGAPAAAAAAPAAVDRAVTGTPAADTAESAPEVDAELAATPGGDPATDPPRGPGEATPQALSAGEPGKLVLAMTGSEPPVLALELYEDGEPLDVTLSRRYAAAEPLLVRVEEVGFSGSRSPGEDGAYRLSGDGVVSFDANDTVAVLRIEPAPNELREADRQVSLRLRDYYSTDTVFGQIELRLLDDDQRRFEAGIPPNSVGFSVARAIVREQDPAVQVDLLRFNPDQATMSVRYEVFDVSAEEGQDYFVPSRRFVTFGPGQRNARLLIPLVQDNVRENDESFMIELDPGVTHEDTISQFAVTIRDDDEDFAE